MAFGSKRQWNGWNFFICFMVSLGQIAFGYPASIIGVTLAQPSFLVYMGLLDVTTDPPSLAHNADQLIGAMSGVSLLQSLLGHLVAPLTGSRSSKPERPSMSSSRAMLPIDGVANGHSTTVPPFPCLVVLSCVEPSTQQCSSLHVSLREAVAGVSSPSVSRFLAKDNPILIRPAPIYSAELAPPDLRGLMVGMNGVNIALGYGLASYMGLAFYYTPYGDTQWRAPLGIALVWPVMMILVCFIIPESPRFLLMKGRVDEAREVVFKLHSVKGDPDQEFARGEFYQMTKQAEVDRTMEPGWVCNTTRHCGSAELTCNRWRCSVGPAIESVPSWPWVLRLSGSRQVSWS